MIEDIINQPEAVEVRSDFATKVTEFARNKFGGDFVEGVRKVRK